MITRDRAVSVMNPTWNRTPKPELHGTEETGVDRPAALVLFDRESR